jgi:hypothetical protein
VTSRALAQQVPAQVLMTQQVPAWALTTLALAQQVPAQVLTLAQPVLARQVPA